MSISTSNRLDTSTIRNNPPPPRTADWLPKSPDGAYTGEKVPFPPPRYYRGVRTPTSSTTIVVLVFLLLVVGLLCWHHRLAVEVASEHYHKVTGQELKDTDLYKALEKVQKIKWKRSEL